MAMQETNTAADRLYRIIRDAFNAPGDTMINVWAQVLHLPTKDRLQVFRGILSVAALVDEVETKVRQQGGKATNLYVRALDQVRLILMSNVDQHKNGLAQHLKSEVVNDLEHCAAQYSEIDHEIPIAKEDVNSIKIRVDELFQDISNSKLPNDLRNSLLELLEVMRQQMAQFEIRGVTALHECLRQALARMMEIYPAIQEQRNEPILKRLVGIVNDIGTVCEKAQKALPIFKAAAKLLPFLSSGCDHNALPETIDVEVLTGNEK